MTGDPAGEAGEPRRRPARRRDGTDTVAATRWDGSRDGARLYVCPQSRLAETLALSGARSVVTLLAADRREGLPPMPGSARLLLDVSDIAAPRAGFALAGQADVAELLAFARAWDRRAPLLIHCYAGVSRSTAAAYAVACALDPLRSEAAIAAELRRASPSATPNPRLVALADAALGRSGRLADAIRGIGRGRDCFEGEVFSLAVPDHTPAYHV